MLAFFLVKRYYFTKVLDGFFSDAVFLQRDPNYLEKSYGPPKKWIFNY